MQKDRAIAEDVARAGGEVVLRYWRELEEIHTKDGGDLVTIADREAEAVIIAKLREMCPEDAILGEETGHHEGVSGNQRLWAIDPLDGTTNFAHGFPEFAVSVGLMEGDTPIAGAIYVPDRDLMVSASLGGGAFCNGKPIGVSGAKSLSESLFISGPFRHEAGHNRNKNTFFLVNAHSHGIRCTGSAAINLMTVAMGDAEGFWYSGLKLWDIAAGALLVTEAGGRVSDYEGNSVDWKRGKIVATNGAVHDSLLNLIRRD